MPRAQSATLAVGILIGAAFGFPAGAIVAGSTAARAAPIQEDEAGWSCVAGGNRICGPGNAEGKPAGCYGDGGAMVAPWPCGAVLPGSAPASLAR